MRRSGVRALIASLAVLATVVDGACASYGSNADANADVDASVIDSGKTGPAGSGLYTGLPCDVQAVLENRCIGCHSGAAPPIPALLDYGDLVATSTTDAAKTLAEAALDRMRSVAKPMPPAPASPADAEEIAPFESWIKAGMAKNPTSCTPDPPNPSGTTDAASAAGDGGVEASCTSGTMWTKGNAGSTSMHPGGPCISCHLTMGGPSFRFAGTVYRGLHEVDDCNGAADGDLFVVITGSNGTQQQIQVSSVGNFFSPVSLEAPYTVSIKSGSKTRKMQRTITGGDCNSCHTATGANGAPGRILAP